MSNEMTAVAPVPPPTTEKPSPPPKRGAWRVVAIVLAVLLFLVAVPMLVVVAAVAYLFLSSSPAKPAHNHVAISGGENARAAGEEGKAPPRKDSHPLDEALEIAHHGLDHIRRNVNDYTATMVARERIGNKLKETETMFLKIRSRKPAEGEEAVPFSVYLKFLEPKEKAGREVIYVEGKNDNLLIGHETGFLNITRYRLKPRGWVAMTGERYPITDIGMEGLAEQLIERGEGERKLDPKETHVQVTVDKKYEYIGRPCTRIELKYPEKSPQVEFHLAEICIDDELLMPIFYAAYSWPATPGGEPVLEEEYTYKEVKVNVGLTDADFDPDNKEYKFP